MKKIYMCMAALMLTAVVMLAGAGKVSAADLQCSLTVHLTDLGTTLAGVEVSVYQVGELKSTDNLQVFLPVTGLEDMSGAFTAENLNQADSSRKTAAELEKYIEELGISGRAVSTDAAGNAVFAGLAPGIYLVRQTSKETEYGVIQPFLAVLPYMAADTGELLYQLEASPKAEAPKPTQQATEAPQRGNGTGGGTPAANAANAANAVNAGGAAAASGTSGPKTGDDTVWGFYILLLLLAAGGMGMILFMKVKKL